MTTIEDSARTPIMLALMLGGISKEDAEGVVAEFRAEVLHEAAERQRAWATELAYDEECVCGACGLCHARELADLIDQAVQC